MYKGNQFIGIIPARGGSKGIPRKNLIDLGGFPLIAWTIIRSLRSKLLDRVIVTSENKEILNIAEKYGCEIPFIRNEKLATDEASSVDVVINALNKTNFISGNKYFVLLQPTSPFRLTNTIDKAIKFTIDNSFNYVMSVNEMDKSPCHIYLENENFSLEPLYNRPINSTRRQDLPRGLSSNGALYIMQTTHFLKVKSFRPKEIHYFKTSADESIDIDTFVDLEYARSIVQSKKLIP